MAAIIPYLIASMVIGVFVAAFMGLGIVATARRVITVVRATMDAMRAPELTEDERETRVQRAGIRLLGLSTSLALRSVAALGAALMPVVIADTLGLAPHRIVMDRILSVEVLVSGTLIVFIGIYWSRRREWLKS
ncbi:hypothetical protein C882_1191 [Caenispirillum salinarum AK4]|uniref:DUF2721 domain-containing protein n=1 Tax=Caenispirillum salinarum AK4 TaxID=1238182 RepID=K9GQG4_9PROT|nr:hypothetical protein [Caenispirillum salinarum]EKV28190.1 hypothetical protein C882_1191 [Caenispirillum salinarum AK4]